MQFVKCDICEKILGSNQIEIGNFIRIKKMSVLSLDPRKKGQYQTMAQPHKQDLCEDCAASVERYLSEARQTFLRKELNENNPSTSTNR